MNTIKLSDFDLNFIRNHYEAELADAEAYVKKVREILQKLGKNKLPEDVIVKELKKRGPKPKAKAPAEPKIPKKRGRKPKSAKPEGDIKADVTAPARSAAVPKKVAKKIIRKRKPGKNRGRRGGRIFLVPLSKPIQLKDKPPQKPEENQGSGSSDNS